MIMQTVRKLIGKLKMRLAMRKLIKQQDKLLKEIEQIHTRQQHVKVVLIALQIIYCLVCAIYGPWWEP